MGEDVSCLLLHPKSLVCDVSGGRGAGTVCGEARRVSVASKSMLQDLRTVPAPKFYYRSPTGKVSFVTWCLQGHRNGQAVFALKLNVASEI